MNSQLVRVYGLTRNWRLLFVAPERSLAARPSLHALCILGPIRSIQNPRGTATTPASLVHSSVVITSDLGIAIAVRTELVHVRDDCVFGTTPINGALSIA